MQAWLLHAREILKSHTASEYAKGMAVIAHEIQRAGGGRGRLSERKQAQEDVERLLASIRETLEPSES